MLLRLEVFEIWNLIEAENQGVTMDGSQVKDLVLPNQNFLLKLDDRPNIVTFE